MFVDDALRSAAFSNALKSTYIQKVLPDNVFVGEWDSFLFFESYLLFDAIFIKVKDLLISQREASLIALVNLGNMVPPTDYSLSVFFFDEETSNADYEAKLLGNRSPDSWMFLMDQRLVD